MKSTYSTHELAEFVSSEVTAKIASLATTWRLPEFVVSNTEVRTMMDQTVGHLLISLQKKLASNEVVESVRIVEYPSDWWQHLKLRWFPQWAVRRWPVVMKREEIETRVTRMCPHLDIGKRDDHLGFISFRDRK